MLVTTTPIIEGKRIVKYYGIVSGETIIGANVFRDLFASIRDIVGGRSGAYEEVLRMAKDTALQEMQAQAAAQPGASPAEGTKPQDGKVNLNTATKEELMTLSGVGESRADSIIAYREENGRFQNTEELMQIRGIKEGLYNKIKDNITV